MRHFFKTTLQFGMSLLDGSKGQLSNLFLTIRCWGKHGWVMLMKGDF